MNDRDLLDHVLRTDLAAFIQRAFQIVSPGERYLHNWHIEVIADHLERVFSGEIDRLIITLPPRYLKSICASVAFPAWVLGRDPTQRIVCASYSSDLAAKHARDSRAVIENDAFRRAFPGTRLDRSKNTETEFTTTARGFRLAVSVGGTLTGRGGNIVIVDDPLKADDAMSDTRREAVNEWFQSTLYSRLDDKAKGRIVVVTQRLHSDDLVGRLLDGDGGWTHLSLPAIAEDSEQFVVKNRFIVGRHAGEALHPEREPLETLKRIKAQLGGHTFAAQYQQDPIPLESGLIKWSWFKFFDDVPEREPDDQVYQSWDTASKDSKLSDYSVCTTWLRRGNVHYLIDVFRDRLDYPGLKRKVIDLRQRYQPDAVLIEDASSGTALIADLPDAGEVYPIAIKPEGDKLTRMYRRSAEIQSGIVLLPRHAEWLTDFQKEMLQFPKSRFDDQIDSVSQYLNWAATNSPTTGEFYFVPSPVAQEWDETFGPPRPYAF